ncbi:phosphoglycerate kinase [Acidimicrobiia bacterium]|nr:phosphoglycerate kinase [Acidimicrobiia bacterium]MDC3277321.1 phosphoglycerate kinase [Acidimicrobiia bacterium]
MSSGSQLGNTLIRADLNVPMHGKVVKDNFRIIKAIEYLVDLRKISKSVTFLSHLGRPDGINLDYSLKPVAEEMSLLLNEEVLFINSLHGPEVKNHIDENPGKVFLLENLRFHNEETENNFDFAKKVTENFDSFILDAFGAAHRNHASIVSFGTFIEAYQGKLMTNEVKNLELLTNSPKKPFSVILGGAKISDKLQLINKLLPSVDNLLIGGGMCFTFLKAQGNNIGKSLYEEDYLQKAKELLDSDNGKKIYLPSDFGVTKSIESGIRVDKDISEFSDDDIGVDISERTIKEFASVLVTSNTVFWNGPMGIFEIDNFKKGTQSITDIVSNLDAYTVVGGGDSVSAIRIFSELSKFNHISTGGGASLKYLQGNELPGVNIYKPLIL